MPFVIYSRDKMQFMKIHSIPAGPKWTTDVAEAMYFDSHTYVKMWWDMLENCQILESTPAGWIDVTENH
jgi:hypothetical protein